MLAQQRQQARQQPRRRPAAAAASQQHPAPAPAASAAPSSSRPSSTQPRPPAAAAAALSPSCSRPQPQPQKHPAAPSHCPSSPSRPGRRTSSGLAILQIISCRSLLSVGWYSALRTCAAGGCAVKLKAAGSMPARRQGSRRWCQGAGSAGGRGAAHGRDGLPAGAPAPAPAAAAAAAAPQRPRAPPCAPSAPAHLRRRC
jgi:hypothetical protein